MSLTMREFNALAERHRDKEDWLNYRTGLICSVMANSQRDPKRKSQPWKPQDFMPGIKRDQQTPEQMFAQVQMLNAAFGGLVVEN